MRQSRLHRHIRKRSIAIIFEKVRRRLRPFRKSLQPPPIHQKNIQPPIIVVVVERHSAAGRLQQIFILVLSAKNRLGVQPRFFRHIDKTQANRRPHDRRTTQQSVCPAADTPAPRHPAHPKIFSSEKTAAALLSDPRKARREKLKRGVPSRVQPVLESVASLYREAPGSLQAPAITDASHSFSRALLRNRFPRRTHLLFHLFRRRRRDCPKHCKETITIVPPNLEITRPVRTWEFLSAVGTQAGIFGNESGRVEAWVYPLKIFRDLHLRFNTGERILNADSLARTVTVRPESTTIIYTSDTFTVRETLFVPVDQPGALIIFDVETEFPLEIEAVFHRDFALEWPAGLGATYTNWDRDRHAFYFGEETKTFSAFFGSPTGVETQEEFDTNYSSARENSFRLGRTEKGHDTKLLVLAASVHGRPDAEEIYDRLATDYEKLLKESADYYRDYLRKPSAFKFPTTIATSLRLVPHQRPAGPRHQSLSRHRPSRRLPHLRRKPASRLCLVLWPRLHVDQLRPRLRRRLRHHASKAIEFISKYQREDGKIPHEIRHCCVLVKITYCYCRPRQHTAKHFCKFKISRRIRSHKIHRPLQIAFDHMQNASSNILKIDPTPPLLPASHAPADSKAKRQQHLL